jgi:hypothetical protein
MLEFERALIGLFNACNDIENDLFDPSHFINLYRSDFQAEEIYYGIKIPQQYKLSVYKLLKDQTSVQVPHPNYGKINIFFNDFIKDAMTTSNEVNGVRSFEFLSDSGEIKLNLVSDVGGVFGILHSDDDKDTLNLALYLSSQIRFFNICIHKLTKFRDREYPVQMAMEGFPEIDEIQSVTSRYKIRFCNTFAFLPNIVKSVADHGFFVFKKDNNP